MIGKDLTLYTGSLMNRLLDTNYFQSLTSEFDKLWKDWNFDMKTFGDLQPKSNFPKINVSETADRYELEIALAGFNAEDISLELKDNTLLIKAEKQEESSEEGTTKKYIMKEISSKSFRRVLSFPKKINVSDIECKHENGIVSCVLKKEKEILPEEETVKIKIK